MKFRLVTLVIAFVALTALAPLRSSAQEKDHGGGKLIEFDPPGTTKTVSQICGAYCGTQAYANNSWGAVVGFYTDEYVVPYAFLRTPDGHFISFQAPGAGTGHYQNEGTVAYSINDWGAIAGELQNADLVYRGFVRYPDGSFDTFDVTGAGTMAGQGTVAFNINLEGATAGIYFDSSGTQHGFVRSPQGETVTIDPLGSIYTMVCEETCLNWKGEVTGFWVDTSFTYHGFLREPDGQLTTFDAPPPSTTTASTVVTVAASINSEGTIAGYTQDSNNVYHGFIRTHDGNFTAFDLPVAGSGANQGTAPFSINDSGAVTGQYTDANNGNYGFSFYSDGSYATFAAPGAGPAGTRPSTNNRFGAVTGWWVDSTGLNHGFVWYPRECFPF